MANFVSMLLLKQAFTNIMSMGRSSQPQNQKQKRNFLVLKYVSCSLFHFTLFYIPCFTQNTIHGILWLCYSENVFLPRFCGISQYRFFYIILGFFIILSFQFTNLLLSCYRFYSCHVNLPGSLEKFVLSTIASVRIY